MARMKASSTRELRSPVVRARYRRARARESARRSQRERLSETQSASPPDGSAKNGGTQEARRKHGERDPVSTVAEHGIAAGVRRYLADDGHAGVSGAEAPRPPECSARIDIRQELRELLLESRGLLRNGRIATLLVRELLVLAAANHFPIDRRAHVEVRFRRLPQKRSLRPDFRGLTRGRDRPRARSGGRASERSSATRSRCTARPIAPGFRYRPS